MALINFTRRGQVVRADDSLTIFMAQRGYTPDPGSGADPAGLAPEPAFPAAPAPIPATAAPVAAPAPDSQPTA